MTVELASHGRRVKSYLRDCYTIYVYKYRPYIRR